MPSHAEKRPVAHTPEQMYALVADVAKYPEFLPWCVGARIRKREGTVFWGDLIIGYKMLRERFTSRVECFDEERRIEVSYSDGPFKHLTNRWVFEPHEGGCLIDFHVDFEFKNRMLGGLMDLFFQEAVQRMVRAFETRADELYGVDR